MSEHMPGNVCDYNPFYYDCEELPCVSCPNRECPGCREPAYECVCEDYDDDDHDDPTEGRNPST